MLATEKTIIVIALGASAALGLATRTPMPATIEGEIAAMGLSDNLPLLRVRDIGGRETWAYLAEDTGFEPGDHVKVRCGSRSILSGEITLHNCSVVAGKWGVPLA